MPKTRSKKQVSVTGTVQLADPGYVYDASIRGEKKVAINLSSSDLERLQHAARAYANMHGKIVIVLDLESS